MIIEETEDTYEWEASSDGDYLYLGDDGLCVCRKQATQLIEVLSKWINGEDIE